MSVNKILSVTFASLFVLSGCATATPRERWVKIEPGQSKDQLVEIMGPPVEFYKDGGHDILVWPMDAFEKCATFMSSDGKVDGKNCKDNTEARAHAMQAQSAAMGAYFQMRQATQPQNNFHPMPVYQAPRPQNTDCTTQMFGGVARTNCQTKQGGVDTSIYNQIGQ